MAATVPPVAGRPAGNLRSRPAADELAAAGKFLALGSFVLFVESGIFISVGRELFLLVLCVPYAALVFHAVGWWFLGRYAIPHASVRPLAFGAFVASLVLFGLSMWGLAWGVAPLPPGASSAFFPFLPWVWAPVVFTHAVLFSNASRDLSDPRAVAWARGGSYMLAGLASVGFIGQLPIFGLGIGVLAFAGWTFVGYLILASCFSWGGFLPPASARPARAVTLDRRQTSPRGGGLPRVGASCSPPPG